LWQGKSPIGILLMNGAIATEASSKRGCRDPKKELLIIDGTAYLCPATFVATISHNV